MPINKLQELQEKTRSWARGEDVNFPFYEYESIYRCKHIHRKIIKGFCERCYYKNYYLTIRQIK